ncbi:NnrU family protein [Roseococcus sp. SDR]|uniref:NnrU family protein n=1 Tax=Roseococcus sp. SDR TaxID=2835532 RepID=UPI001BCB51D6|nr:NnrU family protein [Roseococcus sp. SDR]MBS7791486.1 NnrU protein [Roseococcus sp. SDR]MBV1846800.1 NnrU family protein [Roseococcus sp. SDR]
MMLLLLAAALLWVGVHVGIAGTTVRARLAQSLGEAGFRIAYSILSVVSITLLVMAWQAAPYVPLWRVPDAWRWIMALLMLPVLLLFVASVATPNPTAVAGKLGEEGPRGIQRITRHPMLWSFAGWAALHLIAKGSLSGVLFFGAFLVTALVGMPSIDRKLAARDPEMWARLAPVTSKLPFLAILVGRNRLVLEEIPRLVWIIGGLAWIGLLVAHPWLFGYPALPF